MRRAAALLFAIGLISVLMNIPASAQGPVRSETLYAGAYRLRVDLYTEPPFTGRRYDFDVLVSAQPSADVGTVALTAAAIPAAGTNATEVTATISHSSPLGFTGHVTMTVRGAWNLRFTVSGPLGTNSVPLPLTVAAPTAIPIWLAWTIGLFPLLFLLAFARRQRSALSRLQRQAAPGMLSASTGVAT
jgi:hypothetical protein